MSYRVQGPRALVVLAMNEGEPPMTTIGERAARLRASKRGTHAHCGWGRKPGFSLYAGCPKCGQDRLICNEVHIDNPTETALEALALAYDVLADHPTWTARSSIRFAYSDIARRLEHAANRDNERW